MKIKNTVLICTFAFATLFSFYQIYEKNGLPSFDLDPTDLAASSKSNKTLQPNAIDIGSKSTLLESANNEIEIDDESSFVSSTTPTTYLDRIKAKEDRTSFHDKLITDRANQARYPAHNQKIKSIDLDPVERRYEIEERTTQNEDGDALLTIWSDQKYYLDNDEVKVYAKLSDARGVNQATRFMGQLIYNETTPITEFELNDLDHDGVYEHSMILDQTKLDNLEAGIYKVFIVNSLNTMVDALSFTLSRPEMQLTGEYREVISSTGNLDIQAQLQVSAANRFYMQATLYSSTNDPIGVTQVSGELAPGLQWVTLEFDGMMIRDAGEPGPYLLKSISLAKVAMPIQRVPLIYPAYFTQSYSIDQFRNTTYAARE